MPPFPLRISNLFWEKLDTYYLLLLVRVYGFDGWQPRPYIDGGGLDGNYTLSEIHFHWYSKGKKPGSEHSVNGTHYPIEVNWPS